MKYTRKLQYGGLVLYQPTPISPSMPTAPSQGAVGAFDKQESSWLDEDLVKEIIKIGGLTNETNEVLASLMSIEGSNPFLQSSNRRNYIAYASKINELKQNKAMWDRSYELAKASGGLGEVAVGTSGELYVQDSEGNIKTASISEYKKNSDKYRALSVAELLEQRNSNPDLAGINNIFNVADTSIGMEKISNYARQIVAALGTEKETNKNIYDRDDLAARLSNASIEIQSTNRVPTSEEIKGFAILKAIQNSPSRYNEITTESSSSRNHALKAVKYIWNTLGRDAQNKLSAQAAVNDTTPYEMLLDLATMIPDETKSISIKPVSEEIAKTGSEKDSGSKVSISPQELFHNDRLYKPGSTYQINLGGSKMNVTASAVGPLLSLSKEGEVLNAGIVSNILTNANYSLIVDPTQAYIGDTPIDPALLSELAFTGNDVGKVFLPVNNDGTPNLGQMERFSDAYKVFEINRDKWSVQEIKDYFAEKGFSNVNVQEIQTENGTRVKVIEESSQVKPFLAMPVITNSASDLADIPWMVKSTKDTKAADKELLKRAFTTIGGTASKPKYNNNMPSAFLSAEHPYKGMLFIAYRPNSHALLSSSQGNVKGIAPTETDIARNLNYSSNQPNNIYGSAQLLVD
jgi:hypothetical protein